MCRIHISQPDSWETRFSAGLAEVLSPIKRLSLPESRGKVVWTGGDATPNRIGCVDWTHMVGAAEVISPFWAALEAEATLAGAMGMRSVMR